MNCTIKDFDAKTDKKYIPRLCEIAAAGLSEGFLLPDEAELFGTDEYFCAFGIDEDDRVCCLNYGRYISLSEAAHELRCSEDEVRSLIPNAHSYALHLGLVVAEHARGAGLAKRIMRFNQEKVFERADVIIKGVWVRDGEEKPVIAMLEKMDAVFVKKVPRYWYGYEELYCSRCKGRCVCDCDLYYLLKKGL